jgi:repressor LexA
MKLTKRQKEILDFIREFVRLQGYSPSMEEIAAHFHFASLNAVFKHLEALESRGFLHRDANRARSIELPDEKPSGSRNVALLGYVAAGRPIEAVEAPEAVSVPEDFFPRAGSYFVLRVRGDSMIEDHIQDGDYVVVESRQTANEGDMVVALIDRENVTLKRYFSEGPRVRLQPANPSYEPLVLDTDRLEIQGVIVGVMRKYR